MNQSETDKNVGAWVLMVSAIGLHVLDEALTGFVPFFNEKTIVISEWLGFVKIPSVTFGAWLTALIIAVIILFLLTYFVRRGGRAIRIFSTLLGILMIVNSFLHIGGTVYGGDFLPGFLSSPILLVTAVYVVYRGLRGRWDI